MMTAAMTVTSTMLKKNHHWSSYFSLEDRKCGKMIDEWNLKYNYEVAYGLVANISVGLFMTPIICFHVR